MPRFDNPQAWGSGQAGPGASIPGNNPTNQPPGGGAPLAGAPTPTPAPSQNTAPTITTDGTPQVGETMTGNNGTFSNGSVVSVAWLLNGTSMSTSQTYAPSATGSLIFRNVVTGAGGTANFDSAATTVAAATPAPSSTWSATDQNNHTFSGDLLTATRDAVTASTWRSARGTGGRSTGKLYLEITVGAYHPATSIQVGVANAIPALNDALGTTANSAIFSTSGTVFYNGVNTAAGIGNISRSGGDVISVAFDNGKVWFGRNGVFFGNPAAGTGGTTLGGSAPFFPAISTYWQEQLAAPPFVLNTGASAFAYTPPSGFSAWG